MPKKSPKLSYAGLSTAIDKKTVLSHLASGAVRFSLGEESQSFSISQADIKALPTPREIYKACKKCAYEIFREMRNLDEDKILQISITRNVSRGEPTPYDLLERYQQCASNLTKLISILERFQDNPVKDSSVELTPSFNYLGDMQTLIDSVASKKAVASLQGTITDVLDEPISLNTASQAYYGALETLFIYVDFQTETDQLPWEELIDYLPERTQNWREKRERKSLSGPD